MLEHARLDNSRYDEYRCHMKGSTRKQRQKDNKEESAFIELMLTADVLSRRLQQVIKTEDLSMTQYNVLRILRGTPEGLSCREVADRMITRDPDVTRLLDRLEKRGLISRSREEKDRRTVMTRITPAGLATLERLDDVVQDTHRGQLGHLGEKRLKELGNLLTACREGLG